MTIKKDLKNRVRGWFPKEPKLPKQIAPNYSVNPPVPQYYVKNTGVENSPYILLCLFLPFIVLFNIFVGYSFLSHIHSGSATPLLAFYIASLLVGLVTSWGLLSPIFRKLHKTKEVTVTMRRLGVGMLLDLFLGMVLIRLLVEPIVAYTSFFSGNLYITSSSISFYIFAGFMTGCIVMKTLLPFNVFLTTRRQHLTLLSEGLADSKSKRGLILRCRWVLLPTPQTLNQPAKEAKISI